MDEPVINVWEVSRSWRQFHYQMLTYDQFTEDLNENLII